MRKIFSWIGELVNKDLFRREFGFSTSGQEPSEAERQTVSDHLSHLLSQLKMAEDSTYWAQDDARTGDTEALERYRRRESNFHAVQGHLRRASELAEKFGFEDQVDTLIRSRLETKIQSTRPYEVLGSIG